MVSRALLFTLAVVITDASRVKTGAKQTEENSGLEKQKSEDSHPKFGYVMPLADHQEKEREYDKEDKEAGRSRAETKTMMVWKVQPWSWPFLANSNAADLIGELKFLAKDIPRESLDHSYQVIVQHEVEISVATNPHRAYNHYLRFIDDEADKDPRKYGIDTVGFKMREAQGEGWLSFPKSLECRSRLVSSSNGYVAVHQTVGDGCAWKDLRRVKSIHTTCLLGLKDNGTDGHPTGHSFSEILQRFEAPRDELALDFNQKLAIEMFGRGLEQCPDVSSVEILPYKGNVAKCCCFNDKHITKMPQWVQDGVCLKDTKSGKKSRVFAKMWSMTPDEANNEARMRYTLASNQTFAGIKSILPCPEGGALYKMDSSRGRCLHMHDHREYAKSLVMSSTRGRDQTIPNPAFPEKPKSISVYDSHFQHVYPTLVKSNFPGASLFWANKGYVCPSDIGMHSHDCDCSWADEECQGPVRGYY